MLTRAAKAIHAEIEVLLVSNSVYQAFYSSKSTPTGTNLLRMERRSW
jgi:hypothetical protein